MKISIITATWNCVGTVGDCLASVAGQSHAAREHILIDGGSTDGTLAVIEAQRAALAVLVSEPDGGIYDALNKGIARASGEVVGLLHADDLYADPEVLARIAAAFADPAVDAVYGDLVSVAKADTQRVIRHWRSGAYRPERLRLGWMPPHPTLYLRRELYERHGVFDTRYQIAADYDLMLRVLSRLTGRVEYLPQVLVRMRVGGASNRSLRHILRKSWEDYQALRVNVIDIIAGARPNFKKVAPIIRALEARKAAGGPLRYRLVHTGQHYDARLSGDFFVQLGIPAPDVNLEVGSGTQAEQTAAIMIGYERLLLAAPSRLCLVVGDVTSTMACAIAAQKLCVPVAHVEGGIRSGDWTTPEEINRMVTDAITNWFFTTSAFANANLRKAGVGDDRIFFVGNTMIDTLLANLERLQPPALWSALGLQAGAYFVVTLHRPANVDSGDALAPVLDRLFAGAWQRGAIPELWDGRAGERIVAGIERVLGGRV